MKSITLLLIPLILLSSCTLYQDKSASTPESITNTQSVSETPIQRSPEQDNSGTIKDFGSGFTLRQTNDETLLSYSGKTIKTWSHTPPKEVPFVWDDACTIVWKGFEKLSPENQSTGKKGVWDALTEKEKKECMKENYGNGSIYILQNNNSRFFIITESYYEWANQWVFDTVSGNLQSFGFILIESIQDTGTGIEILANGRKVYTPDFSKEITPKN